MHFLHSMSVSARDLHNGRHRRIAEKPIMQLYIVQWHSPDSIDDSKGARGGWEEERRVTLADHVQ